MIGVDRFASVFGGAPEHTGEHLSEHLRAVVRAGYSPVLCKPGTKEPACILSVIAAKRADRDAQAFALASNPSARVERIRHACGMRHVIDDPAKVGPIVKRFLDTHGGLNVALHLGRSRMLVVDVDTPAERAAFEQSWVERTFPPGFRPDPASVPGITVESPGSFDQRTQTWKHFGGGHWWFELPEEYPLPAGKVLKGPGGWAAMYGESYALVPPATRPEGAYRLVGGTSTAPAWLLDELTFAGDLRQADVERRGHSAGAGGPIDAWSAQTPWAALLEPRGWTETSMVEGSCGCPVWTAPGMHASPKSATAHGLDCARFDVSEGWGPLKIWTDHPPDGLPPEGAVTKLRFVAAMDHGGDDGAAIRALGIERVSTPAAWSVPAEWTATARETSPGTSTLSAPPSTADLNGHVQSDPFGTPGGPPPNPSVPLAAQGLAETPERPSWAPVDLVPFLDGTYVEPAASLMPRSDGVCLLYPGLTHSIHGESESGKSWIVQAESARVIRNGGTVLYIDFESGPVWIVRRLLDLGCAPAEIRERFFYVHPEVKPGADLAEYQAWSAIFTARFTLAVIDGVTDALGLWGMSTKDNDEFSTFAKQLPRRIAEETGAAVVMVDHVTKDKDSRGRFAIGGQAKMATLSGAAYVIDAVEMLGKGNRGVLAIGVAKDRPGGVRGHGEAADRNRIQPIAEFILDSTDYPRSMLWTLNPPPRPDTAASEDLAGAIQRYLESGYDGATVRSIREATTGRAEAVTAALMDLVQRNVIRVESGARGAHHHYLVDPLNIGDSSDMPAYIRPVPAVPDHGNHSKPQVRDL